SFPPLCSMFLSSIADCLGKWLTFPGSAWSSMILAFTTRRGMEWRCPPSSQHHEKVDLLPPLFLAHYFTGNRTHRSDFPSFTSAHGRSSPSSLFAFALISGNEEGPALRDQAGMISHEVAMFCHPSACMTI